MTDTIISNNEEVVVQKLYAQALIKETLTCSRPLLQMSLWVSAG